MDNIKKNLILTPFNLLYKVNPKLTLEILFRLKQGYPLNLKDPKTYNEKLQWIKLYDRNPLMPECCDKYAVRAYIESKGCGHLLNTLLWHGYNPEDIPFDDLPDRFVVKVTHGSTFNIICTDKSKLDREEVISKCKKWLKAKFLPCYGEWFYGKVKPQVIVEQYLEDEHKGDLYDYKVFCFNGKAKLVDVHCGRYKSHKRSIYDLDWNLQEDVTINFGNFQAIPKPAVFDDLIRYAELISSDFTHARVDFYICFNRIYFGEITFLNGAGFSRITPRSFDRKMGDWLTLPIDRNESASSLPEK